MSSIFRREAVSSFEGTSLSCIIAEAEEEESSSKLHEETKEVMLSMFVLNSVRELYDNNAFGVNFRPMFMSGE